MLIREVTPEDAEALWELERVSPEQSRVWGFRLSARMEPVGDYFAIGDRPGQRGLVSVDPFSGRIVGVLFFAPLDVLVNGRARPSAYFYRWRVHPSHRRRGVGLELLARAEEAARNEGAELLWGAVLQHNTPSLSGCVRYGARLVRGVQGVAVPTRLAYSARQPAGELRPAGEEDLPEVAARLNAFYGEHNFWPPVSAESLGERFRRSSTYRLGDLWRAERDGSMALAGLYHFERLALLQLVDAPPLARAVARFLSYFGFAPDISRPLGVAHARDVCYWGRDGARLASDLLLYLAGRAYPEAELLAVMGDARGPLSPVLSALAGARGRLQLVVKAPFAIDESRPSYFAPA